MIRNLPVLSIATISFFGCAFDSSLTSDPNAWQPATYEVEVPEPVDVPPSDCEAEPEVAFELSDAEALSHRAGEACLGTCHAPGGSARTVFVAAGTAYLAEDSRNVAPPGWILHGIGGTTLVVDRCGNFYATDEHLSASPKASQPFVNQTSLHKMEQAMLRIENAGDCNQSGCHDFSSDGTSGIFF